MPTRGYLVAAYHKVLRGMPIRVRGEMAFPIKPFNFSNTSSLDIATATSFTTTSLSTATTAIGQDVPPLLPFGLQVPQLWRVVPGYRWESHSFDMSSLRRSQGWLCEFLRDMTRGGAFLTRTIVFPIGRRALSVRRPTLQPKARKKGSSRIERRNSSADRRFRPRKRRCFLRHRL